MFTEAQNLAVTRTELDTVFYQNFDYDSGFPGIATAQVAEIFKPLQTEHSAYIEQVFKGSGLFPVVGETQVVPLSTPAAANKLTVFIKDFAQGIELSKNLFDDNLHGVWSRAVADLGMVARVSQDQNAFAFWNGSFTTSLTADGAALIASHTLLNGQTYSNQITTSSTGMTGTTTTALSDQSLYAAIVALRQQPNQAGVVLGNVPSCLLVPSALFKLAVQLTDSALVAQSSENAINVYRSAYGITVYTSPYLDATTGGSDTAWFLLSRNHSVTRLIRQGIQTALRDWTYSNNRTYFYQANFRETVYAPDYVGVVGATGL